MEKLHFASDYMEGAHPRVLEKLIQTNLESHPGYGEDQYCKKAKQEILDACGLENGEVFFLVGGTQTNAVVIDSLLHSYQGVITITSGHINTHEAGAIEFTGHKVITLESHDGKLVANDLKAYMENYHKDLNKEHTVMPKMVYLSQPTEYGTLYNKQELEDIYAICKQYDLYLYIDGARLAYGLSSKANDVSLKDFAHLCDAFYIGGTKCGLLFGEAVVLTRKNLIPHFFTSIKQHGALLSKGRLLGVQFHALFEDGLYQHIGDLAITYAMIIKDKLASVGYKMPIDSYTNQIFFLVSQEEMAYFEKYVEFGFMEMVDPDTAMIRFCTSWSTTKEDCDQLCKIIEESKK